MPNHSPEALKTYLFACVHNAGRSQMAAALFNLYADPARCRAISAGTDSTSHVHSKVVEVMREIGNRLGLRKAPKTDGRTGSRCIGAGNDGLWRGVSLFSRDADSGLAFTRPEGAGPEHYSGNPGRNSRKS